MSGRERRRVNGNSSDYLDLDEERHLKDKNKKRDQLNKIERNAGGFKCSHCRIFIPINEIMGTENRNHCHCCLWSKHLDRETPGDRKSECQQGMKPIGLTFKQEGHDKYGKLKQGELMLIHECQGCDKLSINRIAADDDTNAVLEVFELSKNLDPERMEAIEQQQIRLLGENDLQQIKTQLFGKGE